MKQVGKITLAALAATVGIVITITALRLYGFGIDSLSYWQAWRHGLYTQWGTRTSYLYSPAFAQAIWPLTRLPWPVFSAVWAGLDLACLLWLLAPLRGAWRVAALLLFLPEIVIGNLWAMYAVVLVVGFKHPEAWALTVLTKITTGLGLLWFAVRREWRQLAVALSATAAIAALSVVIDPGLWRDWFAFLWEHRAGEPNRPPPPLTVRLPVALALTVVGALRGRPAWLVWGVALASPHFGYISNAVVLAALPRLRSVTFSSAATTRAQPACSHPAPCKDETSGAS